MKNSLCKSIAIVSALLFLVSSCSPLDLIRGYSKVGSHWIEFLPSNDEILIPWCFNDGSCTFAVNDLARNEVRLIKNVPKSYRGGHASLSPDSRKIAFPIFEPDTFNWQIAVINIDGSGYKALTNGFGGRGYPSFSPDGQKIIYLRSDLFSKKRKAFLGAAYAFELDLDTGTERKIAIFGKFDSRCLPRYLPDGRKFVYCDYENILVWNGATKEPNRVLTGALKALNPRISADGNTIAFMALTNRIDGVSGNGNYDIFFTDRRSGNTKRLTKLGTYLSGLALSPDGSRIAYLSDKERNGRNKLWVMSSDGSGMREVTTPEKPINFDEYKF